MKPIAFLHMPKCAGIAIVDALARSGFQNPSIHLFDESLFGNFNDFDTIHESIRLTNRQNFIWNPSWDLVTGHLSLSTIRRYIPDAKVFTILREPRSRLLSFWSYTRSLPDEALVAWGKWARETAKSHAPLAEFLSRPERAAGTDNLFTRFLLGPDPRIPRSDFIDSAYFDALEQDAVKALNSLDFVGLLEDKDMKAKLEIFLERSLDIRRGNVTQPMPLGREFDLRRELNPRCLDIIDQRTAIDRRLWNSFARFMTERSNSLSDSAFVSHVLQCDRSLSPT